MKYIIAAVFSCAFVFVYAGSVSALSPVVISEVQTTGCKEYQTADPSKCSVDDSKQELVELFNASSSDVDVSGWRVEYLTANHDGVSAPTKVLGELKGRLLAGAHMSLSFLGYVTGADMYFGTLSSSGYLAKAGGHVRLVDSDGVVVDMLSWGTGVTFPGWPHIAEIGSGLSAQRLFPGETGYSIDTPYAFRTPKPEAGGLQPWECNGLVITEILANPAGADTGNEFVELYNPTTDVVHLSGCSIRLNDTGGSYAFEDGVLQPGEYKALSDSTLGFSLPNATGGTVWLLSTNDEQGIVYPASIGDGVAWALIDGAWKETALPTAGAANSYKALSTEGGKGSGESAPLPCPAGKYRSPLTHRCRALAVAATQSPCREGYTRNPITNRCRSLTTKISASLTPCKPGYARNSVTNRCRSVKLASVTRKPCGPGQERSSETNRCRKIISASAPAYGVSQAKPSAEPSYGWWLAGAAGAGITSYGLYEWRREIASVITRVKAKVGGK